MEKKPIKGTRKRGKSSKRVPQGEAFIELYVSEQHGKQTRAATSIQRAWRRWLAELLDSAAGIHIRFRLGGLKFPPSIYYKIFTHRPIVDICANSPKDYTKPLAKMGQAGKLQKQICEDRRDWYKRIENNGWRLLSLRFWKALDPVTAKDNLKIKDFHYCKVQKKQEAERIRKTRKIEWLKKMYFGESLQVKTKDSGATILIQRAAEGLIGTLEKEGIDNVMEWEVDEILKWTNALNYEEYVNGWREIGTSRMSNSYQGFRFSEQQINPSELCNIPETIQKIVESHVDKKK
ncbi:protein MFI isoform X2 [Rhineura floridana]|uniref:protein MFI isoform X2 n=1 Tax=Rhineura floridana TaxID=261503 RepID=UPI002AC81350|nr:protein MFI isoform X2 [Rhineura floridana]